MKLNCLALFFAVPVFMLSCLSGPVTIPDHLTTAELIQRAQEASDRNNYRVALQYYEAIASRFPYDIDSICAAEYEIAFIHFKQKKYDAAKAGFRNLLERYNVPDEELLPPQFKVLAKMVLERIAGIERLMKNEFEEEDS